MSVKDKKLTTALLCLSVLFSMMLPIETAVAAANANPSWTVDDPVIFHRECPPYDYYGAKDPTIVYYDGKYHVFYTGAK